MCSAAQDMMALVADRHFVLWWSRILNKFIHACGSGSLVGIASGYGLDGPGIESHRVCSAAQDMMALVADRHFVLWWSRILNKLIHACGPGSLVGIASGYGLDGPGIESRWGGEIFRTCPDRPWGPPSLLHNG